ncbi:GNAT family N-acetyltransferase [Pontixanthobacter aquaemixtae]|uniref:GNAT family N-acetyltransferase n=1 Tax=Pontixanthobacter aquaemixtae TaxID=1958940 RepID=A0A844ZSP8_9SPHN|nr:GNAT family N-acetyltransferase [Pontixanthobacter aquaemixtae]MXO90748.1 GNAT family N-acetyltransferase [Pontixanthobacter aquaemixtae]
MQIDINLPDTIRLAGPGDWRQLADITAQAFRDDPVNRWIFGNPRSIRSAFRVLTRDIYSKRGICHLAGAADNFGGATMWMDYLSGDPGSDLSVLAQLHLAIGQLLHGGKGSMKRAIAAGELMAKHHPQEPHFYLFTIGTLPSARGTGLGKALLAPVLEACDRAGAACYLENSNPDNHSYYAMHGFETREKFACGEGGPPLEAMWRNPRPNGGA